MSLPNDLVEKEKAKYEKMWGDVPSYRVSSPGFLCADIFFDHFGSRICKNDSITDYGCGPGLAALRFLERGLYTELVDIAGNCLEDKIEMLTLFLPDKIRFTKACLWDLPETLSPTDWIYSIDVLEHIPPEKIDAVLSALAKRTLKGGTIQIFTQDETFGSLIGETLHLTIEPKEWWQKKLEQFWEIEDLVTVIPDARFSFLLGKKR